MSFEYNGATISARELSIADENRIRAIALRLNDATAFNDAYEWAEYQVAATVEGTPPVPLVTERDSEDAARASYAAWTQLPRRFVREWRAELRAAEAPNASTELL